MAAFRSRSIDSFVLFLVRRKIPLEEEEPHPPHKTFMKRLVSPWFSHCNLLLWWTTSLVMSNAQPATTHDSLPPVNPYVAGCLHASVSGWTHLRVCNSDDLPEHIGVLCQPSEFAQHVEVRIKCQDWESVTFSSWVVRFGHACAEQPNEQTLSLYDVSHFVPLSLSVSVCLSSSPLSLSLLVSF